MTLAIIDARGPKYVVVAAGAALAGVLASQAQSSALSAAASALSLADDLLRVTQGLNSDIFVSQSDGLDTATGLSYPRAKQTLAAGSALLSVSTSSIALISGSHWREELPIFALDYNAVSTGSGDIPVIDGSDIVTGWVADGAANVWQKSWTHAVPSGSERFIIVEDGKILTRVANVATCSATPGSFVDIRSSEGSPVLLRVHATGSGNPNTNGKLYEASRRWRVLSSEAAASITVSGPVEVTKAVTNNGAAYFLGDAQVSRVLSTYGTKHNFFLGSSAARDCIAWYADKPTSDEGANTLYVSYKNDPRADSFLYERCGAVQPLGGGTALAGHACFFAHSATIGHLYISGTIRQCWGHGAVFGGHPSGAASNIEQGCYWRGMSFVSSSEATSVDQTLAYIFKTYDGASSSPTAINSYVATDCAYFYEARTSVDAASIQYAGGNNSFTRCSLVMGAPHAFNAPLFATSASSGTFTFNNSIAWGFSGNLLSIPAGVTYVGNNNVFGLRNEFNPTRGFEAVYQGVGYTTLSAWQTATSQDANSVYVLAEDQVAGDADAFWLGHKEAAALTDLNTVGPAVGDFRVNPTAKVYNAAGTPLTGTFADGTTPITAAGPNKHWDWDRRASVSGAPNAFPTLPVSLAECRDYIAAPNRWAFY